MPFLLLPLGVLGGGGVSAFQGHQWYQNITTGEPWVGGVDILQDEYGVPDVSVKEMYSGRCPH